MHERAKLVSIVDLGSAHRAFKELLLSIPATAFRTPVAGDWSAKDLAAHLSSWDEIVALDLVRLARGHMPMTRELESDHVDELNTVLLRSRKRFPRQQVVRELELCYDALIETIDAVPESVLASDGIGERLIRSQILHYDVHTTTMRRWRSSIG
jgi:hypothetical protein